MFERAGIGIKPIATYLHGVAQQANEWRQYKGKKHPSRVICMGVFRLLTRSVNRLSDFSHN
ncbi:hypothetical protein [Shewanella algae]|uniref:hypothetical protein n=1 Tax=Shewanella algae TaxID=38313 RepID=UPI0030058F57|nr:hypothetical protein [Shewanella algae]